VLAAVQLPDPVEIPDPDLDIIDEARPEGVSPDEEKTWATAEASDAQSVAAQQNQSSNQDLQTVSNEVSADEVSKILLDDVKAIEDGHDNYDEDLCESIGKAIEKFGHALDYYDSLTSVVVYLDGLAVAYNSRAPLDMATAITDAQTKFQQALGVCVDNLETIHWILEQIQNIFCDEGE
jgi:alpha-L-fucosidase